MPRLNRKSELFQHITEVGVFRDTAGGGSSTIASAPPVAGALTVVTAASGTGFVTGDWVRVGGVHDRPEINQGAWATAALTPYMHWFRSRAVGDVIVEQSQVPLGHIAREGVRMNGQTALEAVGSATRTLEIADLAGYTKVTVEFNVLGLNIENVLTALGMLDTNANIAGAGTQFDTERAFINGAAFRQQNDLCWYVNGTRKDGRTVIVQFWGCEVNPTALQLGLARGRQASIPISLAPTHAMRLIEID